MSEQLNFSLKKKIVSHEVTHFLHKSNVIFITSKTLYRERVSNPYGHYWPKDFKSFASTYSAISASL